MAGDEEPLTGVGPTPTTTRRPPPVALVLTGLAQGGVLFVTFVMGLLWVSGWISAGAYAAALLQAVLLGGVIFVLARRQSWLALAVPLISAALTLGLFLVSVKIEGDANCTEDLREAAAQLTPLPGTTVNLHGEPGVTDGCIARFSVPSSDVDKVLPHYRREFTRRDWEITAEEPDRPGGECRPRGELPPLCQTPELVATKGRIVINVSVPEGEGGLVIIEVTRTS